MGTIRIGVKTISGNNISLNDGRLSIDGVYVDLDDKDVHLSGKVKLIVEGNLVNVTADGDVECQNVEGNVRAGMSVHCDDVKGSVNAGMSVHCDNIQGNVSAGMSVHRNG